MKFQAIELLFGRPKKSIIKIVLLLSLLILLFINIISSLFSHPFLPPPLINIASLASFPNSTSSLFPSSNLNSYSHSNFSPSYPPSLPPQPPPPSLSPKNLNFSLDYNSSSPPLPTPNLNSPPPNSHPSMPPPPSLHLSPSASPPKLQPSPSPSLKSPTSYNLKPSTSTSKILAKECNLSEGEWVRDWEAPYYTNMTCYTIQEHQNCMKYGRPDTDFLKWRWKPDGCELPPFDPARFLELMRGKSLAFVGDSLARNHVQSLMCLLSQVEYPEDISQTSDDNIKRMFYSSSNFTIWIFWSPFLIKAQETSVKGPVKGVIWNLYLDEVDDTWASHMLEFNYVIISAGNWFNRPSMFYEKRKVVGCLYCQDKKVTKQSLHYSHRKAFRIALLAINKMPKFKGIVILRTVSPSHFENGVWDKGGNCVRTKPFRRNETRLEGDELELYKAQIEEFNLAKRLGGRRKEFRLLDTTKAMLLRPDGHPSRYGHWPNQKVILYNDCVHWCLPGPIDMWNDFFLQMLST